MKLNWNFLGGQGVQNKKPSVGGVWIFSGTAQYKKFKEIKICIVREQHSRVVIPPFTLKIFQFAQSVKIMSCKKAVI